MLCLLEEIYVAQRGRDRDSIIKMSAALVQELWLLVILGPICVSCMRAQSIAEVFLSDASQGTMASVRADVPQVITKELQRHCLSGGTWSRLLSPWESWQKLHAGYYWRKNGVPLVSHPIWLAVAQCLQFRHHHVEKVWSRRRINLLELESVLEVERRLALRRCDCRYLFGR